MSLTPTAEQSAIIAAARDSTDNLMLSAYAGCAKTSSLEMLSQVLPKQTTLALAFNKRIATELTERVPGWFEVLTMNGLGHRVWSQAIGSRLTLDDRKIGRITSALLRSWDYDPNSWEGVRSLVSAAMQAGLVPKEFTLARPLVEDTEENWADIADEKYLDPTDIEIARAVLTESINEAFGKGQALTICFDDQIYLPVMFRASFPKFSCVMVDEAQDLSPLNHLQVQMASSPKGRLIICGDPKQAIYAWRGADGKSMEKLRALRPNWIDLPLTLTFRCPKAVVERQQKHAPGYTAALGNATGKVLPLSDWTWRDLTDATSPTGKIAIICRNNAPLMSLAMQLIKIGIGPVFLGKDIGKGLVRLVDKIVGKAGLSYGQSQTQAAIENWRRTETAAAKAAKHDGKIAGINDRADCLLAVLESSQNARELKDRLKDLFEKTNGQVTLTSGHRCKGLEWETVVHMDPWRVPSNWATAAGGEELEQEWNLKYVIETRSKNVLFLADLNKFLGKDRLGTEPTKEQA